MVCPNRKKRKKVLKKALIVALLVSMLAAYSGLPAMSTQGRATNKESLAAPLDLVINEVLYNPPGSYEQNDEWIEVKNIGSTEVNMSGWNLTVKNTGYNIYAPPTNGGQGNITLQPGEFAVLTPSAEQFLTNYPNHTGNVFDCDYFQLSNSGDVNLALTDPSQRYDNITYNGDSWPGSDGYSMELMYPDQDNNDSANWATSLVYNGTPGEENSMYNGGPSDYPPTIHETSRTPSVVHNKTNATIKSRVTDDHQVESVNLHYRLDGGAFTSLEMMDDGSNGDEVAGDDNYTGIIPKQSLQTLVEYYVKAKDNATQNTTAPEEAPTEVYSYTVVSTETPSVTINEFLPDPAKDWNDDGTIDSYDEFIELYNDESQNVNISGWYLDDEADGGSTPFQVPDGTTIPSKGLTVFYKDETGVGLNNGEDNVRLMRDDQLLVDSHSYTSSERGVSHGRSPDGGGNWYEFSEPTPGSSNPDLGPQEINESVRSLLITEVYYQETLDMDFVVLHNPSNNTVPLSFFEVSDQEGSWTFPIGATIPGEESIYLAFNGEKFEERMFFKPDWEVKGTLPDVPDMEGSDFNLASGGDEVILKAFDGSVIDVVAYGDSEYHGVGWQNGPAPGVSTGEILTRNLEPQEGYIDTNTSDDWVHPFVKGLGQSDFEPREFEFHGKAESFVSPDSSFPAVTNFINSAEERIYLNVYMITNWYITREIIDALDRDVEVKVFLEGGPVGGIPDQERYNLMKLADAGAKIRYMINDPDQDIYSRYRFNHAKYCVADNSSVLVISENWKYTGVPVNNTYGNRGWGIILHNQSLASYYADVFLTDYNPEMPDSFAYDADDPKYGEPPANFTPDKENRTSGYEPSEDIKTVEGDIKAAPVIGPDTTNAEEHSIAPAIKEADETLDIIQLSCNLHWAKDASAYIDWDLPPETQYLEWSDGREHHNLYLKEAINAARRGVEVDVLLDSVYIDRYDNSTYDNYDVVIYLNELAEKENIPLEAKLADHETLGIEKVHAKGLIVDNETVLISSINWGAYAAIYNRETGILVTNQDIGGYYADVFHHDWTLGKEEQKDNWTDGDDNDSDPNGDDRNEFEKDTIDFPTVSTYPDMLVNVGNAVIVVLSLVMATAFIWDKLKREE
ncbi:MAG: lamin tail domain-containing protein [Candidatus Thermoplasmatota archaeon]